jgi:hypothetical protein
LRRAYSPLFVSSFTNTTSNLLEVHLTSDLPGSDPLQGIVVVDVIPYKSKSAKPAYSVTVPFQVR